MLKKGRSRRELELIVDEIRKFTESKLERYNT